MIMLVILILIFFSAGPVLLLFASGYSFKDVVSLTKISILRTGGVYVASIGSNSSIFVDNKPSGDSSFLDRSVLAQGLSIKQHLIKVERPGFRAWEKKVTVSPNKVTEVRPVLIPEKVLFMRIRDGATIETLSKAFLKKKDLIIATSTGRTIIDDSKISILLSKDTIKITWKNVEDTPQYMCSLNNCEKTLEISLEEPILDVEWYKDDTDGLVAVGRNHIFILELDARGGRIITPVFASGDFKLENFDNSSLVSYKGEIYLKKSSALYKLNFEPLSV